MTIPSLLTSQPSVRAGRKLLIHCILLMPLLSMIPSGCSTPGRGFNEPYSGSNLDRIAFPIGGIGAGMICLEGTGAISHVSVRNAPRIFNEPHSWAALCVLGEENTAKVLEGSVPMWKAFGGPGAGNGASGSSFGLPRFREAVFETRFPFGRVMLDDPKIPFEVEIGGWSPFIPGDADESSLPVGALEYHFRNPTGETLDAVFSFNSRNFMAVGGGGDDILPIENGFVLWQEGADDAPYRRGGFAVFVEGDEAVVDHSWFKGGWWDSVTMTWKNVEEGIPVDNPHVEGSSPGASLFVPFTVGPGETKTIRLLMAWHVPVTNMRYGRDPANGSGPAASELDPADTYMPWYAGRFADIHEIAGYWRDNYDSLRARTLLFSDTFYDTDLPAEVVEAVAANLTILKSPTVLRETNGRLWCWEGCSDNSGCCAGSCTHVWNYAQAISHLFPELERSLRETEYHESQSEEGHQTFRSALPIRPVAHIFHAACDGQLGGVMKVHREWKISGDRTWLERIWTPVTESLNYCIRIWDPRERGVLEEPHHNTYDIEFWGPDGMSTGFYLGALSAAIAMGEELGEDVDRYRTLLEKGKAYLETELFNGEYFYQQVVWEGYSTNFVPVRGAESGTGYAEIVASLNEEGPKYQYGTGCLSDVVLGLWIARMCGLDEIVDEEKVRSTLNAIHKYNLKHDLTDHPNPQRPSFALGTDGGLLLCTWPKGGALSLPFVYSNEVWTGIEYQVASHLMIEGLVEEGLEIVRVCRDRYDGTVRNPFNEYECGHWYARAMSSYGLIQGLTGVRYDAAEKTLYVDSRIGGSFRSFLSTATGFGTVGLRNGRPFIEVATGRIDVDRVIVSGREVSLIDR